jgi:hypothetical protein
LKLAIALFAVLSASAAQAQTVTPSWSQGSSQSTSTTTVNIQRTVAHEIFGGEHRSWSGTNVTASGDIANPSTTFSVTDASQPWQMEIVDRPAGLIETIDITEDITQTVNETTLSIFSQ